MSRSPLPENFARVSPYLVVDDPKNLVEFLQKTFAAEPHPPVQMPDGSWINAQVQIGTCVIMIGAAQENWPAFPSLVHVYVEDVKATFAKAIANGAKEMMPPTSQFYGDFAAGVTGPQGNIWWIASRELDLSPEEINQAAAKFRGQKS